MKATTGEIAHDIVHEMRAATWRDYYLMTKPTVAMLVVITVIPGLMVATSVLPKLVPTLVALFGTFLAASSAAVFNQLLDADIDANMKRTRGRPIPAGKISNVTA